MGKGIEFTIYGKPIAKKRPRFFRRGDFVGTYNPQETEEGLWMLEAKQQIPEKLEGALSLKAGFFFPPLKSWSKKMKTDVENGSNPLHIKKPDLDNLLKFVKDCLNGLAWNDDSQVCKIEAVKCYDRLTRTDIVIKELSD